ncbi:DNA binding protein, putative [Plasmodium gallinaceum]|uniref:3'-5' exonuclease n=1 Tax=Plasmodium gallinaceum TaxID=5849 RepID=A0A1J1GQJ6_PLAGA|nr:DNA binding protein, putative [Plasmodium gallinaceum]CRG93314.1 DNA binding protein, putative [Plasmodium gallinaceum]
MFSSLKKFYKCSKPYYSNKINDYFNPLKFTGIVIYVNQENVTKYEKSIIKYLKTDIVGFDTEFVIDINNSNKKFLKNFEKTNSLINNISEINTLNNIKTTNKLLEKKYQNNLINKYKNKKNINKINIFKKKKNSENTYEENKKLCLIQLSSNDICFVFNINKLKGKIPQSVKEILENDKIIKVCHDIKNDKDMFLSNNIEIKNVFDLYNYSIENFIYPPSLQSLVKIYLKKFLDKNFRLSNWLSDNLIEEQILYAALDAYASREVYMILKNQNKVDKCKLFNLNIENDSSGMKENIIGSTYVNENKNCVKTNGEETKTDLEKICDNTKNTKIRIKEIISYDNNYNEKKKERKKGYEYLEKNKSNIINNLKNEINMKCSKINNITFLEEMVFSNDSYKNVLYLKHIEKNNYLIKLSSFNYDDEINCCNVILNYINKMS